MEYRIHFTGEKDVVGYIALKKVNFSFPAGCAMLSGLPVMKMSMPMTSWPSLRSLSQRWDPINPAAPVIRIRVIIHYREMLLFPANSTAQSTMSNLERTAADTIH